MNFLLKIAAAGLVLFSTNAFAQESVELSLPRATSTTDILESGSLKRAALAKASWIYLDGEYFGTLYLRRLKRRGSQSCTAQNSFDYSFVVATSGRYASVYLEDGTQLTGSRRARSFRTILDTSGYTYRVRGRRCVGYKCFFTLQITKWVTGSTYCKGIYKAWMYADN